MQVITFSSLTTLKIFNAVNAGVGAWVGHPTHNFWCCLGFLDKNCTYLDAESLYEHIKQETFQTRTPPQRQALVKRVRETVTGDEEIQ